MPSKKSSPQEEIEWIGSFMAEVAAGQSAKTAQLVTALLGLTRLPVHGKEVELLPGLDKLMRRLRQEDSPAKRNSLLRAWLASVWDEIQAPEVWSLLGFPPPPLGAMRAGNLVKNGANGSTNVSAATPANDTMLLEAASTNGSRVGGSPGGYDEPSTVKEVVDNLSRQGASGCCLACDWRPALATPLGGASPISHLSMESSAVQPLVAGAVVFDFDMTLTSRHISAFQDISDECAVAMRFFGGHSRVDMLREMFQRLTNLGVAIAVVSRNAQFVIRKVFELLDLAQFLHKDMVFGLENFDDEIPKSDVVLKRIMPRLGITHAQILFVDDDKANLIDMRGACPHATVLQAEFGGITTDQVGYIIGWAEKLVRPPPLRR